MDEHNKFFNELIIIPTLHKIKAKETKYFIKKYCHKNRKDLLTLIYNTSL